jgi:hypothetical protein
MIEELLLVEFAGSEESVTSYLKTILIQSEQAQMVRRMIVDDLFDGKPNR